MLLQLLVSFFYSEFFKDLTSILSLLQGQWSLQPTSILHWFASVVVHLEKPALERFLVQMATPIFRISEDPNAQDPQMGKFPVIAGPFLLLCSFSVSPPAEALQNLAKEVQDILQKKIGTTAYSAVHTQIRQKAAERRNERKVAIALQVCFLSSLKNPTPD